MGGGGDHVSVSYFISSLNHFISLCVFVCVFVLQIADYYYEERVSLLRCVLLLLTYFQDERHPYRVNLGLIKSVRFLVLKVTRAKGRGVESPTVAHVFKLMTVVTPGCSMNYI